MNGRIDLTELRDRVGTAPTPDLAFAKPYYVNGGKQAAYQLSFIWNPTDYLRFMAQYAHVNVTGGPRGVEPLFDATDTTALNKRKFDSDVAAVRAQVDF